MRAQCLQNEGQWLETQQALSIPRSNWPLAVKMMLLMATSVTLSATYVAGASDWIVILLLGESHSRLMCTVVVHSWFYDSLTWHV